MAEVPFRYGPASLTGAAATLFTYTGAGTGTNGTGSYTGASGSTVRVIKEIRLVNETAATLWATVSLGADATGKRIAYQVPVPANGLVTIGCWVPMFASASEIIQALCQTANGITIEVAGVDW